MINEKLCLFCEHYDMVVAEPAYPPWSSGNGFELMCEESHWDFDENKTSKLDLAECLQTAKTCIDYTLSYEAKVRLRGDE